MVIELCVVVGARPNFIKAWPVLRAIRKDPDFRAHLIHSGQHYDASLSSKNISELKLPPIDTQLELTKSGSPSTKYSSLLKNFFNFFSNNRFDAVIVFGDVNTTVAASVAASSTQHFVVHVESGLRSNDMTMPEEVNRIIVDNVSDMLITSEEQANVNLIGEGFSQEKVHFCGNAMIETLIRNKIHWKFNLNKKAFILVTAHRADLIYNYEKLKTFVDFIQLISATYDVLFPLHPATKRQLLKFGLHDRLLLHSDLIEPLSYFEFLKFLWNAKGVITDSGGIQEEAVFLNKPIITIRENTERPITLATGFNVLKNINELTPSMIKRHFECNMCAQVDLPLWDDLVSSRILKVLKEALS